MFYVQGVAFNTQSEYELALSDDKLINEIKAKYDLTKSHDVRKLYADIRNLHFKTKVGDDFDDYIYELYQKIKNGTFEEGIAAAASSGSARETGGGSDRIIRETGNGTGRKNRETGNGRNTRGTGRGSDRTIRETERFRETSSGSGSDRVSPRDLSRKKAAESLREELKAEESSMDSLTNARVARELKRQNLIRSLAVFGLLAIAAVSLGIYAKYYRDAGNVQQTSDELSELRSNTRIASYLSVKTSTRRSYSEDVVIPDILDEYAALYNKNKSMVGWVRIEDTVIDYPVMQTEDNEYYLSHNFDLKKDANGCIFLDAKCDIIMGNTNFILYGHHMNNGKMFSSLIKYANKDFYEKHKTIQFDTIYEKGTYEVMYAFRSRVYSSDVITFKYYQFIDANSEEEFNSNMEEMAAESLIDTGVTARYGDRLLTLSTCDYQEKNGRFVVVARRID